MILQFLYILADYLIKDERERVLNAINFNKAERTFSHSPLVLYSFLPSCCINPTLMLLFDYFCP